MIDIDRALSPSDLLPSIDRMWEVSASKVRSIEASFRPGSPTPVFTVEGRYQAQGWTEWTEGFQHGSAILQFDATGDTAFLELGRERTRDSMASHVTHVGVHDHGFNNVSTYGNLLRLAREGAFEASRGEIDFYELALKATGAVQAARWAPIRPEAGGAAGYIYSFNGPQSLFVDTIRSCRALAVSHSLGHALMGERDQRISLLGRLIEHARATAKYNVYYGEGRDIYDVRGRACHEALFNTNNGDFRAPSTQQGYSAFSTWTRGQAWAVCGFPEELEWLATVSDAELEPFGGRTDVEGMMMKAARATADFYLEQTPTCGVPYWDTGAPGLASMPGWDKRIADPFNEFEPVDSSAAAIAAQGLLRLAAVLDSAGEHSDAERYRSAGLTTARTLLGELYTSGDHEHQGLLLHAVYHRPCGWDHVPEGRSIPCGESCMWGDYHLRELALYIQRLAQDKPYYTFFGGVKGAGA
ncbi:MAG: glycosyl hydrolase [Planctomycetota bacterium]